MKISARNQFVSTVTAIKEGAVNGTVTLTFGDETIKASITMEAINDLGLEVGKSAVALVKATNVLVAAQDGPIAGISARNQFVGTVSAVKEGAVNGHVSIKLAQGDEIFASITNESIEELGLEVGKPAVALVKSTDVLVGVE